QRAAALRQVVAGGAERGEVIRVELLHLVDEQGDAGAQVGGDGGGVGEELGQVGADVAGVGPAADRDRVDARVPPLARGGAGAGERLEHAQHVLDPVRG